MTHVSVILATFNRKDEVLGCVESILDQTYKDFELLIMDDGSIDGTAAAFLDRWGDSVPEAGMAEEFIKNPLQFGKLSLPVNGVSVHYVYQKNRGFSNACNRGFRMARGMLVAFVDPDIRWAPRRLERQTRIFHDRKTIISVAGQTLVKNGRTAKRPMLPGSAGWIFGEVINDRAVSYNAALIHRRCLEIIGGFDENLPHCEDYDLWVRLTANFPIHTLLEPLIYSPQNRGERRSWATNRFRVYALEKAFQSGYLNPEYRAMVAEQIVSKCQKLVEGFQHKKNTERANFYERKRRKFTSEVRKLSASRAQVEAR